MHIKALEKIVGTKNIATSSEQKLAADKPWREAEASDKFLAVVDWSSVEQLQKILRYCNAKRIGVVPRAGGTSLSNGASISTYRDGENYIILRDARQPSIKILGDTAKITGNATAKTLEEMQKDWLVPVDLGIGSKAAIATILGYLATDAAGSGAAFKGRAIDMVETLQVVLANGKILDLPSLIRNSPKIEDIVGMGGTTGIITSATIKLIPRPKERSVAALRVENIGEMYDILEATKQQCWADMNLFERMNERLFNVVATALGRVDAPETLQLQKSGNGDILFIEVNADKSVLEKLLQGHNAIITDIPQQADFLLEYRVVNASTKGAEFAKNSGGKMVAFDISVPMGDVAEFPSKELIRQIQVKFAGVDIFYFGHAAGVEKISATSAKGGTALHFNPVLPKALATKENEKWLRDAVFAEVAARGGQIVSEHGIGTKFVSEFKQFQPEEYAATAQKIARLDPNNILNRGAYCTSADVAHAVKISNEKQIGRAHV